MEMLTRREALMGTGAVLLGAIGVAAMPPASDAATGAGTLRLRRNAWHYDGTNDVYYQLGNSYAARPAAPAYENLAIYVPGRYFRGTRNSDGLYTTSVRSTARVGAYTGSSAPIVFPVNTPGYAAQAPPTTYSYSDVSEYLEAGLIYVAPGLRGRDVETSTYTGNAPWGVVDLKAAIRYIRYNADLLPGSTKRLFVFGMSGGGAQTAVAGSSGDSPLYEPYLKSIEAALTDRHGRALSDAIAGAMCWCPITSLDWANASYEWNMGQFASAGTRAPGTWTREYSRDLASVWGPYLNALRLKDSSGKLLTLNRSSDGEYLAGSYYEHIVSVIEYSLNDFLSYTTFPYTPASMSGGRSGGPPSGTAPSGSGTGSPPSATGTSTTSSSTTYETAAEYIAALNADGTWIDYDATKKTAKVLSLEGFVDSQKTASKDAGAFDGITRGDTENLVFGHGTDPLHFAEVSRTVIENNAHRYRTFSDWSSADGAPAYDRDFTKRDSVGKDQAYRGNMMNPMYYLSPYYAGYGTGTVAPHWRIRTGIMQGDTANTTEVNLALAIQDLGKKVDFATVWGEGHTMAETTGQPTANFIAWVRRSARP